MKWAPDGEKYLIVINNKIDVYSVEVCVSIIFYSCLEKQMGFEINLPHPSSGFRRLVYVQ